MPTPSNIVVLLRSRPFFGAQLVLFPALYQLKKWLPESRLRVVARDPLGAIYQSLPWVNEFCHVHSWREEWQAIGPDCAVLAALHPSSERHGLLAWGRRPPIRLGFRNHRLTDGIWTHGIPANTTEYRGLHMLKLLAAWRELDPLQAAHESVQSLAAACPRHERPTTGGLLLMPGGGAGEFKKWGLDRYLALIKELDRRFSWQIPVHIVLGPAEAAEAKALSQSRQSRLQVWMQPSLPQLAALVTSARLIVANDCGPSHLAQCSATPLVSLFDSLKPEWFWPRPHARCLIPASGSELHSLPVDLVSSACAEVMSRP